LVGILVDGGNDTQLAESVESLLRLTLAFSLMKEIINTTNNNNNNIKENNKNIQCNKMKINF
jgi:hypothetical protein